MQSQMYAKADGTIVWMCQKRAVLRLGDPSPFIRSVQLRCTNALKCLQFLSVSAFEISG